MLTPWATCHQGGMMDSLAKFLEISQPKKAVPPFLESGLNSAGLGESLRNGSGSKGVKASEVTLVRDTSRAFQNPPEVPRDPPAL